MEIEDFNRWMKLREELNNFYDRTVSHLPNGPPHPKDVAAAQRAAALEAKRAVRTTSFSVSYPSDVSFSTFVLTSLGLVASCTGISWLYMHWRDGRVEKRLAQKIEAEKQKMTEDFLERSREAKEIVKEEEEEDVELATEITVTVRSRVPKSIAWRGTGRALPQGLAYLADLSRGRNEVSALVRDHENTIRRLDLNGLVRNVHANHDDANASFSSSVSEDQNPALCAMGTLWDPAQSNSTSADSHLTNPKTPDVMNAKRAPSPRA